ncbi:site-specific DNA-methyltransferase [Corynebacterium terpenotabidum]|nr:site-specific DNA-methyltransferase [Corynebacterium terpenotabidum]
MEKLRMTSPDLTAKNIDKLAELFPSVITEVMDSEGNTSRGVDFDLLRQELLGHLVEGPQERYRLDWPGKRAAMLKANAPIVKTLRPVREESVDFDTTKNLFIEGDNLEALKLLQESYLGKVKLIYIDPPYNTGNDFIYNDNFSESVDSYLFRSGQLSQDSGRLVSNPETSGRYHSNWLSMMYPRLKLARNFLSENGVMLVSIDSHELHNMIKICDEIFGAGSHKNTIAVRRGIKNVQAQFDDVSALSQGHEYILLYGKNDAVRLPKLSLAHIDSKPGKWDTFWRGTDRPTMRYSLFGSTPKSGQWRWEERRTKEAVRNYERFLSEHSGKISLDEHYLDHLTSTNEKLNFVRLNDKGVVQYYVPPSVGKLLSDNWMDLTLSGNETDEFDTEKSVNILSRIIGWITHDDDLIMDFFAGSGTAGHATYAVNAIDGGNRRYILVQISEPIAGEGGSSIATITRARLRKAGEAQAASDADTGLRALTVDTSNMADVARTPDGTEQLSIDQLGASIKPGRTSEDLLFQVLLDWGLELSMSIKKEDVAGHELLTVEDGALIACFDQEVSPDIIREIARREPLRAVFRDDGFEDDAARINAEQIFREMSPKTDIKAI